MSEDLSGKQGDFGLVLTGGGARGAYQAGVIEGISQILSSQDQDFPFRVLSGSSAGAINCAFLACNLETFQQTSNNLSKMWKEISFADIYKTDFSTLAQLGMSWAKGLSFGGAGTKSAPNYLLDTSPLYNLIKTKINFSNLHRFEKMGGTLAINTTHYQTGATVTFFSDVDEKEIWKRTLRFSYRTKIEAEHILASSAIPVLFPPVKLGPTFYGDGAIRMKTPMSPAIHLGATKILAIGVKKAKSLEEVAASLDDKKESISLAEIAGTLLNSVFLDSLDADLERLDRINQTIARCNPAEVSEMNLRHVEVLKIQPSEDLGELAQNTIEHFPRTIRYLMKGAGADDKSDSDLLSYLSFHHTYTIPLVELGIKDAFTQKDRILKFFSSSI